MGEPEYNTYDGAITLNREVNGDTSSEPESGYAAKKETEYYSEIVIGDNPMTTFTVGDDFEECIAVAKTVEEAEWECSEKNQDLESAPSSPWDGMNDYERYYDIWTSVLPEYRLNFEAASQGRDETPSRVELQTKGDKVRVTYIGREETQIVVVTYDLAGKEQKTITFERTFNGEQSLRTVTWYAGEPEKWMTVEEAKMTLQ